MGRNLAGTMSNPQSHKNPLRERIWRIIFLSDTPTGKAFDVALLWVIALPSWDDVLVQARERDVDMFGAATASPDHPVRATEFGYAAG